MRYMTAFGLVLVFVCQAHAKPRKVQRFLQGVQQLPSRIVESYQTQVMKRADQVASSKIVAKLSTPKAQKVFRKIKGATQLALGTTLSSGIVIGFEGIRAGLTGGPGVTALLVGTVGSIGLPIAKMGWENLDKPGAKFVGNSLSRIKQAFKRPASKRPTPPTSSTF